MYDDLDFLLRGGGGRAASLAGRPQSMPMDYDASGGDAYQQQYTPPPHIPTQMEQMPPSIGDAYQGAYGGMLGGAGQRDDRTPITAGGLAGSNFAMSGTMGGVPYQGVTISPEANGARPYDPFNSGLQPSPFMVKDSFMENGPIHTLGYSSRHGISSPTVDYSGMAQRAGIDRHNMEISRMLGNQDIARESNKTDMMRTMMGVQQRNDAAKANAENRYMSILGKVPEGKRTPYIEEGLAAGHLDRTVSQDMLQNEMLARAKAAAKTGSGVDLRKFLGSLSTEFDHNKTSRSDLIQKLQQMGYTADQIDAYKNDPQVGRFAQSLLGPRENFETYGLSAIGYDAADRGRQLWSLISGR